MTAAVSMRNREKRVFLTAKELEERAKVRVAEAERLPPGEARQHALKNAAQLRSYAAMKRLQARERSNLGTTEEKSDVGS